jgi:hypothetical protein
MSPLPTIKKAIVAVAGSGTLSDKSNRKSPLVSRGFYTSLDFVGFLNGGAAAIKQFVQPLDITSLFIRDIITYPKKIPQESRMPEDLIRLIWSS